MSEHVRFAPETFLEFLVQVEEGLARCEFRAPLYGVFDVHENIYTRAEHWQFSISIDIFVSRTWRS